MAAGADAVIGYVCQAVLEPADEVVVPWPSFPSFVRDPQKRDAVVITVPLTRARSTSMPCGRPSRSRTRLVFVATPNNPTGRTIPRDDADRVRPGPPGSRAAGDRRGVLRLSRAGRPARRDRRPRSRGRRRARPADVLEALRPGGASGRLRGRADGGRLGDAKGSARLRRRCTRPGGRSGKPRRTRTRSRSGGRRTGRRYAPSFRFFAGWGSSRYQAAWRTSCSSTSEPTPTSVAATLLRRGVAVQSGVPFGAPTSLRIGAGSAADLALLDTALREVGLAAR